MNDPYLKLYEIAEELWQTKKILQWAHKHEKVKAFTKIDKLISEVRSLDFEQENNKLKEYYEVNTPSVNIAKIIEK